jgi:hypothetical protein
MIASRVLTWCGVGCLLAACGDSKKDAGTSGGGAGGPGGGGTASGGTAGSGGSAGASGAGGEGGAGPLGGGVEGIYALDDAVLNTASRDPGGTSVRAGYAATHLVVRRTTIAGTAGDRQALVVTGCSALAACRTLGAALVDDATAFELAPYSVFTRAGDGDFAS